MVRYIEVSISAKEREDGKSSATVGILIGDDLVSTRERVTLWSGLLVCY